MGTRNVLSMVILMLVLLLVTFLWRQGGEDNTEESRYVAFHRPH